MRYGCEYIRHLFIKNFQCFIRPPSIITMTQRRLIKSRQGQTPNQALLWKAKGSRLISCNLCAKLWRDTGFVGSTIAGLSWFFAYPSWTRPDRAKGQFRRAAFPTFRGLTRAKVSLAPFQTLCQTTRHVEARFRTQTPFSAKESLTVFFSRRLK